MDTSEFGPWLEAMFPMVDNHPDVAGALRDPTVISGIGAALAAPFHDAGVSLVIAPEARGPILGALVARELDVGLALARKLGQNHPGADINVESDSTWRGHAVTFQIRSFDISPGATVLVVDDWITTGSSIRALSTAIGALGATYVGATAIVDKAAPTTLNELNVHTLVGFDRLMSRSE